MLFCFRLNYRLLAIRFIKLQALIVLTFFSKSIFATPQDGRWGGGGKGYNAGEQGAGVPGDDDLEDENQKSNKDNGNKNEDRGRLPAPIGAKQSLPVLHQGTNLERDIEYASIPQLEELILTAFASNKTSGDQKEKLRLFLHSISSFITDELLDYYKSNYIHQVMGRESEIQEIMLTLVKEKMRTPLLLGPSGSGKTSILKKLASQILHEEFPPHPLFYKELGGAYVVETTPGRISRHARGADPASQAYALEAFLDSLAATEKILQTKIVLFIDEIHSLNPAQIEALKPYLENANKGIRLIAASTGVEFQNTFKYNPAIKRRFEPIGISELNRDQVLNILKEIEKPRVETRYGLAFQDEALERVVELAPRVYAENSLLDGSIKLLEKVAAFNISNMHRSTKSYRTSSHIEISGEEVLLYLKEKLNYPVDPLDIQGLKNYRQELLQQISRELIGQDRMVQDLLDEWMKLLRFNKKGVRSVFIVGPSGVGKSLLGRLAAEHFFGSESAFLEIDANIFKSGGHSANTLTGAHNGVMSSNRTSGMLGDFLDDPGRGKNGGLILFNEIEKAHPEILEKLMEMLDTGKLTGSDGLSRRLGRHLVVFTSNRGDGILFPKNMDSWSSAELKRHLENITEKQIMDVINQKNSGKDEYIVQDSFLGRIDKFTIAAPILHEVLVDAAVKKAQLKAEEIKRTFKLDFKFSRKSIETLVDLSYQPGLGVRPVERKIEAALEEALDQYLVAYPKTTKGSVLHLSLNTDTSSDEKSALVFTLKGPSGNLDLELADLKLIPKPKPKELIGTSELLNGLAQLNEELKQTVIGQEDMIERISQAIKVHQTHPNARPLSFFLLGSTGTGKTETAKTITKVLFKSPHRMLFLDMGKIQSEGEFNNIFGSPVGYVGSQDLSTFELFLRQNPQGGVILFDEISNLGGNNRALKNSLFKKLYSIFEEGVWVSPSTKTEYQLAQYILVSTGNDLKEIFDSASADDLRITAWKQYGSSSKVRRTLINNGVPEEFLGRQADVILMKPLLSFEVEQIAGKIFRELTNYYETQGIKISAQESFIAQLAQIFYSHDQGVRGIRNLVDHRLKSLVTELAIQQGSLVELQKMELEFSLNDNKPKRFYARKSDPTRKVMLTAHLKQNGIAIAQEQIDVTNLASPIMSRSRREIIRTAFHEAGHASVNQSQLTNQALALITVKGADGYFGYARYEELPAGNSGSYTREKVVAIMAKLLAGQMAEQKAGFSENSGWQSDLKSARRLAKTYILNWGLAKDFKAINVDSQGNGVLSGTKTNRFYEEMEKLFDEATRLASESLNEQWPLVRQVVYELFKKGEISGSRFYELKNQWETSQAKNRWNSNQNEPFLKLVRTSPVSTKEDLCESLFLTF